MDERDENDYWGITNLLGDPERCDTCVFYEAGKRYCTWHKKEQRDYTNVCSNFENILFTGVRYKSGGCKGKSEIRSKELAKVKDIASSKEGWGEPMKMRIICIGGYTFLESRNDDKNLYSIIQVFKPNNWKDVATPGTCIDYE